MFKIGDKVKLKMQYEIPEWMKLKYGNKREFKIAGFCHCGNNTHPGVKEIKIETGFYIGHTNKYELVKDKPLFYLDAIKQNEEDYYE